MIPKRHIKGRTHEATLLGVEPFAREYAYFLACIEAGNISKAAEALDVQQAGLSKILARLEEQLEQKLFHRTSRGLVPTEYGKILYQSLLQTQMAWRENYSRQLYQSGNGAGALRIGCHPVLASTYFSQFIPQLIKNYPDLKLEVDFGTSTETTRRVAEFKTDVGIVINPVKNADLVVKPFAEEQIGLWKGKSQRGEPQAILYNPEMFLSQKLLKKISFHRLIGIGDYQTIATLIGKSNFWALLPNPIAENYGLVRHGEELLSLTVALIWHRETFLLKERHQLLDLIVQCLKENI